MTARNPEDDGGVKFWIRAKEQWGRSSSTSHLFPRASSVYNFQTYTLLPQILNTTFQLSNILMSFGSFLQEAVSLPCIHLQSNCSQTVPRKTHPQCGHGQGLEDIFNMVVLKLFIARDYFSCFPLRTSEGSTVAVADNQKFGSTYNNQGYQSQQRNSTPQCTTLTYLQAVRPSFGQVHISLWLIYLSEYLFICIHAPFLSTKCLK